MTPFEFIMAGATAVQVGTCAISPILPLVSKLLTDLLNIASVMVLTPYPSYAVSYKNMSRKENRCRYSKISEITGLAAEGNALGRHGDMVVFVPFGAPGDIADVKTRKEEKIICAGTHRGIEAISRDRVQPPLRAFYHMRGCRWQHLPYRMQLEAKHRR